MNSLNHQPENKPANIQDLINAAIVFMRKQAEKYIFPIGSKTEKYIEKKLIPSIPGTESYKKKLYHRIKIQAAWDTRRIMRLSSIKHLQNPKFFENLLYFETERVKVEITTDFFKVLHPAFQLVPLYLLIYLIPSAFGLEFFELKTVSQLLNYFLIFIVSVFTALLAMLSAAAYALLTYLATRLFWFSEKAGKAVTILINSFLIVLLIDFVPYLNKPDAGLKILILYQMIGILIYFMYIDVFQLYFLIKREYSIKEYYDAWIVKGLCQLLYALEKSSASWVDFSYKKKLIDRIEFISKLFFARKSKRLMRTDSHISRWFDKSNDEMALAFRELKRWVLLPKIDSREQLIVRVSKNLTQVVIGDWDSLEKNDVTGFTRFKLLDGVGYFIRLLISISIPFLIIFIATNMLHISEGYVEYLKIGAVIWLMFSLIYAFDPQVSIKTSKLSEFIPIFRLFEKK